MTVCSKAFVALGRAQSSAMGERGLPIIEIPHPFGSRSREEIVGIAQSCAEQIHAHLEQSQSLCIKPIKPIKCNPSINAPHRRQ